MFEVLLRWMCIVVSKGRNYIGMICFVSQEESEFMLPCLIYLASIGILSFAVGRLLPKKWFDPQAFPYRAFPFEKDGALYRWLRIQKWQNRIPDMSRILPGVMPRKAIVGKPTAAQLEVMLRETCVAECIHVLLCFGGLLCIRIWSGVGGIVAAVLFFGGNIPFVLVQRYNRPRLQRLYNRISAKEAVV